MVTKVAFEAALRAERTKAVLALAKANYHHNDHHRYLNSNAIQEAMEELEYTQDQFDYELVMRSF